MNQNKLCGIYKLTNSVNGKYYIGSSVDITTRWTQHKGRANRGSITPLYNAIRKYGPENFKLDVMELCQKDQLRDKEQSLLNECVNDRLCYNVSKNAYSPFRDKSITDKFTRNHSIIARKKQQEAALSRYDFDGREYPALINDITNEIIPSGRNIKRLCRTRGLEPSCIFRLVRGKQKKMKSGWRVLV